MVPGVPQALNTTFHEMKDDQAQVDLGVAVGIGEQLQDISVQRQPKKRFVGRRQADGALSKNIDAAEDSAAIQGEALKILLQPGL